MEDRIIVSSPGTAALSKSPARRIALELLGLAETSRHPLADLLERKSLELEAAGGARDIGLLRHLVLGTLRWRLTLDALLASVSRRPLETLEPRLLNLLRLGAFQLLPGSRIPAHAAVNETVRLAKRLGHAGVAAFANGVMRSLARQVPELLEALADPARTPDPLERLSVETSHPRWLVERWAARLGIDAARSRCRQDNLEPPVDLRVNLARVGLEESLERLRMAQIRATPLDTHAGLRLADPSDLPRVLGRFPGEFYVQSRLSQIAGECAAALARDVLGRRRGGSEKAVVLDACAAPGGKSLVLSQELPPGARLLAHDKSPRRLERLRRNFASLGLSGVEIVGATATGASEPEPLSGLVGRCSLVLLDAPCSALGVLRRHPEMRWRRASDDPARLGALQSGLLARFASLLEPGGVMLYVVCSFEPEETESVVAGAAAAGLSSGPELAFALAYRGIVAGGGGVYSLGLEDGEDGYFLAAMTRPAEAAC
jgi:16S rRNA (cytosine967-C5)-methyltransferase